MNLAAETVVRWYLSERDVTDDEATEVVEVLKRGIGNGEEDSVSMLSTLMQSALRLSIGTSSEDAVAQMLALSRKLELIDKQERQVDALIAVRAILAQPAASPMASRVQQWKVSELVTGACE